MGRRPAVYAVSWRILDPGLLRGIFLAALCLLGVVSGHLYAKGCDAPALHAYLTDYCTVYDAGGLAVPLSSCLLLYYGYEVGLFLLSFASFGVILIPALAAAYGFFFAYTICGFVQAYGRQGILLAMGALAVRVLFTLPCFLALAESAWPLSMELASLTLGSGKRVRPVLYSGRYFILFGFCMLLLTVGVFCERFLTPWLFRMALKAVTGG